MISVRNFLPSRKIADNLNFANIQLTKSLEKLTTGKRINSAGDDPAGLGISKKLWVQIDSLNKSYDNTQAGISLLDVVDGALSEISSILNRMSTLANQSASGTYTDDDREIMQDEFASLLDEIDRISGTANFNLVELLSGNYASGTGSIIIQVGANEGELIAFNLKTTSAAALGVSTLDISTQAGAETALNEIQSGIQRLMVRASDVGAISNRLKTANSFNRTMHINYSQALSYIEDTDFATELMNYTKTQMLSQAGAVFLAQANLQYKSVFALMLNFD